MASISSLGIGSNLDLDSLLQKLGDNAKLALDPIEDQASSYQAKFSAYSTIKSVLSTYQTAAKKLADVTTFGVTKATVGSTDVMTAATGSNAVPGSYSINVTSLAQAQSLVSKNVADSDTAIGTGKITFEFGERLGYSEVDGGYTGALGFNADTTRTKTVEIKPGQDSLEDIRDAINAANIGVTASIVNDGSGTPYRLVMSSTATGDKSSMRISADSAGLSGLVAFDPSAAAQPSGMQETVRATSAKLKINGIDVVSQSNTVADAAQGVTLTLNKTGTSSLTVTRDTDSVKAAIQGFVNAYNGIQSAAKGLTAFDSATQKGSPLTGDTTLRNIQSRLRGMLNVPQSDGAGGTMMLSDIGVSFALDGTLKIDDSKLTKALNSNLGGVTAIFSNTVGAGGYGKQVSDAVDDFNGTSGALKSATDGITATLKDLEDLYDRTQQRIDAQMEIYRVQFTQLDLLVSQMNQTSSYLTQQFDMLANVNKK